MRAHLARSRATTHAHHEKFSGQVAWATRSSTAPAAARAPAAAVAQQLEEVARLLLGVASRTRACGRRKQRRGMIDLGAVPEPDRVVSTPAIDAFVTQLSADVGPDHVARAAAVGSRGLAPAPRRRRRRSPSRRSRSSPRPLRPDRRRPRPRRRTTRSPPVYCWASAGPAPRIVVTARSSSASSRTSPAARPGRRRRHLNPDLSPFFALLELKSSRCVMFALSCA